MKYKAVVFDMDGTLLDTIKDLGLSLNYSLEKCGYGKRSLEEIQSFIGNGVDVLITCAMPDELKEGIDTDERKKAEFIEKCKEVGAVFREYYVAHGEDNTVPYDCIIELLSSLKTSGVKVAVVSNKVQEAVDALNDRLFGGLIDASIGDRVGIRLKPYPDMIIDAMDRLSVDKTETVFVGDGDTDILSAKNAGIPCISVCYGYRTEEFLRASGGTVFAHDVAELKRLLEA